jgi:hypothetical protein
MPGRRWIKKWGGKNENEIKAGHNVIVLIIQIKLCFKT